MSSKSSEKPLSSWAAVRSVLAESLPIRVSVMGTWNPRGFQTLSLTRRLDSSWYLVL